MALNRRFLLTATAGTWLGTGFSASVLAQPSGPYPNRAVRFVVPFPAGIPIDILLRSIGPRLSDVFKQAFIVENKPGAGANIGIDFVARAPADGYSILSTASNFAANPSLYAKVNYDPLKDFVPVVGLIRTPAVLMVAADSPIQSLADLVARAKADPAALKYASGGNGTLAHFAAEMLKAAADIQALHVPYKSGPEMMTALLSKTTDFAMPVAASTLSQIQAGKFRALAVTSNRRMAQLPTIPTLREALPRGGFDLDSENGLVMRTGTPPEIVTRLHQEIVKIMRDPQIADPLVAAGYEIVATTPAEFGATLRSDVAKYSAIIQRIGLKLD
jgi:tripartite-type tricarboxylate transporter receptor subunit TctC